MTTIAALPLKAGGTRTSPWRTFAITVLAVFVVALDTTVLFVAFQDIRRTFPEVSESDLSWVLNTYTIVFGALLIPAGRLADRFGRRRLFLLGVGVFSAGSVACGLSPSARFLIAARGLQAFGAAALLPASLAIVLSEFPGHRRASAVAAWGAVGALATAAGPGVGASVVQLAGWRWAFFLNVPIGLAAMVLGRRSLRESTEDGVTGFPDPAGIVLAIGAGALLAFGILESGRNAASGGWAIGSVTLGLALVAAFVVRCRRAASPVLDLALFEDRTLALANLSTLLFVVAFITMFFGNVFFLTRAWGYSLRQTGLAITPGPLVVIPCAIVAGRIADRRGHRLPLIVGALLFAVGGAWLVGVVGQPPSFLRLWLPGALMTGAGVGLVLPSLNAAAVVRLPLNRYAVGAALNQAVRQFGTVLGVALVVALVGGDPAPSGGRFRWIYLLPVIAGPLTALLALGIRTGPSHATPGELT